MPFRCCNWSFCCGLFAIAVDASSVAKIIGVTVTGVAVLAIAFAIAVALSVDVASVASVATIHCLLLLF